jgi:hypothetical protein
MVEKAGKMPFVPINARKLSIPMNILINMVFLQSRKKPFVPIKGY